MTKTGTREWSEHSVNCCLGCAHGCLYCYARHAALRFGRIKYGEDWTTERVDAVAAGIRHPEYKGVVMFPTTHDVTAGTALASLNVLVHLLDAGNRVLLVSKGSAFARVVLDCARHLTDVAKVELRVSLTCLTPEIAKFWEPGAPTPTARLDVLWVAANHGYKTTVSIEPCLEPARVADIVHEAEMQRVEGEIWIGAANQLRARTYWCRGMRGMAGLEEEIRRIESWQTPERMREVYESLRHDPQVRWKDSYQEVLGIDALGRPVRQAPDAKD